MKIFKLITVAFLLITWGVKAHQPGLSSIILVENESNKWILQIRTGLTALESEVNIKYAKGSYKTPEEFKQKVIEILKENVSISFDGKQVVFTKPRVKLGHETIVLFEFEGGDSYKKIDVTNTSFKDIYKSKSTLLVLKNGFKKNKFTLEKENNYSVRLIADRLSFKEINPEATQNASMALMSVLLIIVLITALVFVLKKRLKVSKPK